MSNNHELENKDLRPTTSNQAEEVQREKEEERELENRELNAVAGGMPPADEFLDPNVTQG